MKINRDFLTRTLLIVAASVSFAAVIFFVATSTLPTDSKVLILFLCAVFVVVLIIYQSIQRDVIDRLHDAILDAQEGTLSNITETRIYSERLHGLAKDYNIMMNNLSAMFSTVEECQNRVLNERNKMDALLGSMPGALISVDDSLNITSSNPLAAQLFNCEPEWLFGKMLFDVIALEPSDHDTLRDAFLYKQEVKNFVIHTHIAGEEHYISVNIAFYSKHEANLDAVITLQDITNYQNLLDSVYNREKLVAMGQMAAGIAHELNTPLGNILGYSQLLCDSSINSDKKNRYAEFVVDEARRCSRIVNDLLNYARRDTCSDELCDVNTLVNEMIDTFLTCRLKRQETEIQLDLQPYLPRAEVPCGELDIVLSNLMLNALYELDGRTDGMIKISTRSVGSKNIELSIEDNGRGVPVELRRKIFEPFYTTKEAGDGTGLGLSISQAMMTRRGCELAVDSEHTAGARFIIRLRGVISNNVEADVSAT